MVIPEHFVIFSVFVSLTAQEFGRTSVFPRSPLLQMALIAFCMPVVSSIVPLHVTPKSRTSRTALVWYTGHWLTPVETNPDPAGTPKGKLVGNRVGSKGKGRNPNPLPFGTPGPDAPIMPVVGCNAAGVVTNNSPIPFPNNVVSCCTETNSSGFRPPNVAASAALKAYGTVVIKTLGRPIPSSGVTPIHCVSPEANSSGGIPPKLVDPKKTVYRPWLSRAPVCASLHVEVPPS